MNITKEDKIMEEIKSKVIEEEKFLKEIDTSKFEPLSIKELSEILEITIKKDEENKIVTFLCMLSAYTEDSQINISFNAPSSSGKSYIALELSKLFPEKDLLKLGGCSPTAFFHEQGAYDKEKNEITVDLEHKIIIFLEMPHNGLLERLRSLLSHDEKEIKSKITDKNQKGGNRTKTVVIKGYPSVIFCTAGLKIDEQESTRFILLSPEIDQEKIREGILETIKKEVDSKNYNEWVEKDPRRKLLRERIEAIKEANIQEVKIPSSDSEMIEERFSNNKKFYKPRHLRDIKKILSFIKCLALLNLWWREKEGLAIIARTEDIEIAFELWEKISLSQELSLSPYVYELYRKVILAKFNEKNNSRNEEIEHLTGKIGITRKEVLEKHYKVYGRPLDTSQLRQQILPMLETVGLIFQEQDKSDKRSMLIYPAIKDDNKLEDKNEINSVIGGGVSSDLGIF